MPLKHGLGRECMNVSGDSHLKLMERPSVCFDLCVLTRHQAFEIKWVTKLRDSNGKREVVTQHKVDLRQLSSFRNDTMSCTYC